MSFFRSEPMVLCHLILHYENAFDCIVEVGERGLAQFITLYDADAEPNEKFDSEIKRCNEILRTMKRIQDQINEMGMRTVFYDDADELRPLRKDLPEIEEVLQQLDGQLIEVQAQCESLQAVRFRLYENMQVLEKMEIFLTDSRYIGAQITGTDSAMAKLLKDATQPDDGVHDFPALYIVTGSIPVARFAAFELMIWRVSRGNAIVRHTKFELTPDLAARTHQHPQKYAFLVACVGEYLREKIPKICQGFDARTYPCASTATRRKMDLADLSMEFETLKQVFKQTCDHKKRLLYTASVDLFIWRLKLQKMLQVYQLLNSCGIVHDVRREYNKYLKTDCWIPRVDVPKMRAALRRGANFAARDAGMITFPPLLIERNYHPQRVKQPTFFRTNKFTRGFQNLIDGYGVASYRELNPAPYTIVTFPFLFAVMFGDVAHGIIMLLFAWALVWREKKIERNQKFAKSSNEIFELLFAGRYIIMLMGAFSIYTGFIYNDFLSKPVNIFGSSWRINFSMEEILSSKTFELNPANRTHYVGSPYIFGLDPIWNSLAINQIILNNSLKMKMAIILGVLQMLFGLMLSGWNALFFRSKTDFFLVFLPQIIFLTCLFLYLVLLIFYKWAVFGGFETGQYSSGCAPSILITFINMILMKSGEPPPANCEAAMFSWQFDLQRALLFIALLSVPILLCGKPFHFIYQNRHVQKLSDPEEQAIYRRNTLVRMRKSLIYNLDTTDSHLSNQAPENQLSEVWIHQGIHTIECVLGSVSHTASYLRLWALSLAHSQLSHVLWSMVLEMGLTSKRGYYNSIVTYFAFAAFAVLTVAILVVMEGLSAFLHTLRLHWVEFQSKFYSGQGEAFQPFAFPKSKQSDSYK